MLSVQPVPPSASARPTGNASAQPGPRLKRTLTSSRVGVETNGSSATTIQTWPSPLQRSMDLGRAARSVMAIQAATVAGDGGDDDELTRQRSQATNDKSKRHDPWAAVIRKVVRKAGGSVRPDLRGNNSMSIGEEGSTIASHNGASKPASLAQLLKSRKVKNLVRQAIVAREWSSKAAQSAIVMRDEPSMVMEQWVKTAALRSQQQQQQQQKRKQHRRRRNTNSSDNSENLDAREEDDDDGYPDDQDDISDEDEEDDSSSDDSMEGLRSPMGVSDVLHASKHAYSRHLLLEESCRRALAQSGDRRSDMDLHALRSWFQTTKLKISTDFDRLPPSQLDSLCRRMTGVSLAPNEVVFHQGDEGDALYVVFSGSVEVRVSQRVLGEQVEVTVCELTRGDYFGERSLLNNDARAATVVVTSSTELVKITRADYDLMLRNDQLEFLSRMQMTNGGSALAGLPKSLHQSQREYLKILGKTKHSRSKADIALLSEYLQTLKFFRALPVTFVRELCGVVDLICFSPGDIVFHEGEVGDLFYIIFSGSVDVLVGSTERQRQQQTKLINLTEGAHFGELALMKGRGVRSATVIAREESKLLVICEKDYNATLRRLQKRNLARRVAALDKIALFQTPEWTRDKLRDLSYVLVDQKLATGTVLFKQGDKAQHVYFVVRGELVAERAFVNPLAKLNGGSSNATMTVVVERISRFRMIGEEAASGATFNDPAFREVTVTASTPVELLVLSKYDVFHRLPPAMCDALRCGNCSSGYSNSNLGDGSGPRVEPVVYLDRFVKSAKWEALKRRVVHENVNHERIAKRLGATASASPAKPSGNQESGKMNQSRESAMVSSSPKGAVDDDGCRPQRRSSRAGCEINEDGIYPLRPLVDANEFLLVPSEREAVANSFVRADCIAGHASLSQYVTGFNADAPPSEARSRQLTDVLAAEHRRNAHILNEGNPFAYFDADDVRRQHRLQLQQQHLEEGESWSRQSSSRRIMAVGNAVTGRGDGSTSTSITMSMSQCLQDNYIFSLPVEPSDRANRRPRRRSQRSGGMKADSTASPHRSHALQNEKSAPADSSGDPGGDGDYIVVRFRFTHGDDADSNNSSPTSSQPKAASAFQIIQSVRSPLDAREAVLSFLEPSGKVRAPLGDQSDTRNAEDHETADAKSGFFMVSKKFAVPPVVRKALEEQLQQQVVERFGRWPAAQSGSRGDEGSNGHSKAPTLPPAAGTTSSSTTHTNAWSRGLALFASFDEVALPVIPLSDNGGEAPTETDRVSKSFAVASVVLSRREIINGSGDEPFLCVHGVFASEAEAMDYALHLGPPPLRNALVCVLPTRQWVRFEDAYEWCVQVEPDRREKRASSSTLVVSPNRNKPPTRPVLGSSATLKTSSPSPSACRTERVEATRLHQLICARMGLPRNSGGDESGFTPKPVASLEDKLAALQEYLDVSSSNVTTSRGVALAAAATNATASASTNAASSAGGNASVASASSAGEGSKLLGKVRQVTRFGSILRACVRIHKQLPTGAKNAAPSPPFSPSRASISAAKSRRATVEQLQPVGDR